jgi:quinol---cytochrome-c reductase cytochrome c subunit
VRLLRRWLTHRSRVPRGLRAALAVVLAALAVVGLAAQSGSAAPSATAPAVTGAAGAPGAETLPPTRNGPWKPPYGPPAGDPYKSFPTSPQLISEGQSLYQAACSSCHGFNLRGIRGRAPALIGVGPGPVDFYLSTGRMPLDNPYDEPARAKPAYTRPEIMALIAYISQFGGPPAPLAQASKGNIETGFDQFTLHCAGCHQIVARGGMFVGAWVPNLLEATPQQVAEAIRAGPYLMPHFDYKQISQYQMDSIAKYVEYAQHPDNAGGWSIGNIGPIPEGIVAFMIGLGALVIVARLIGETTAPE